MNLLKSGEFAHLCGTTKEALRHYNEIGLLSPVQVAENGYHLYSPAQTIDYLIISTLKSAGFTLSEIRQYFEANDIRKVDTLFQNKHLELLRKLREIETNIHLLANFVKGINDARLFFEQQKRSPCVISLDEASYIQTSLMSSSDSFLDLIESTTLHAHLCKELGVGLGSELASSYRLSFSEPEIQVKELSLITFFEECDFHIDDSISIRKRPAGQYIETLYPLSDSDAEHDLFAKLNDAPLFVLKNAEKLGVSVSSDIFISEVGRYSTEDDTGLLVRLRAPIKPLC